LWGRDFYLLCTVFSEGEGEANLNWRFKVGASMKSSSDNVDGAERGFFLHDKLVPFYGHDELMLVVDQSAAGYVDYQLDVLSC
jgi:hypothetical protein